MPVSPHPSHDFYGGHLTVPAITDKLKAAGLRITQPRRRLISILEQAERPLSADEILAFAPDHDLDLVTVYRNVTLLCELGLAQSVQLENGKQLFELQADEDDHHHHIICRHCHAVVRLDLCFGAELEKYARSFGFSELNHTIEVHGTCTNCASQRDSA